MLTTKFFTFFDQASSSATSSEVSNPSASSFILSVGGSSFSGSCTVQGQQGGIWCDLATVKLSDVSVVESITEAGGYAVLCPEGFVSFRVVATIDAGELTVTGRFTTEV